MHRRISFDDPVYRGLREGLNSRIRLTHKIRIGELIPVFLILRNTIPETPNIINMIETVDDLDLRNDLRTIYDEANRSLVIHMITRSPFVLILTVFAPLFILIELLGGKARALIAWLTNELPRIVDSDLEKDRIMQSA